jgi:hypothetical protein
VGSVIKEFKRIITKEIEDVKKKMGRNYIYPLNAWRVGAYIITVKCADSRYNGSQYYFSRKPENDEEGELMEKFTGLSHALECPRPDRCPTCLKYVDQLARSF